MTHPCWPLRAWIALPIRTPASGATSSPRIQSLSPRPAPIFCWALACAEFPLDRLLVQIWHPNRRSARRRRARTWRSAPTSAPSGRRASLARCPPPSLCAPHTCPPSPSRVRGTLFVLPMTASSLSPGRWQEVRRPGAGQDARRGVEEPDRCRQGEGRVCEVGTLLPKRALRCAVCVSLVSLHFLVPIIPLRSRACRGVPSRARAPLPNRCAFCPLRTHSQTHRFSRYRSVPRSARPPEPTRGVSFTTRYFTVVSEQCRPIQRERGTHPANLPWCEQESERVAAPRGPLWYRVAATAFGRTAQAAWRATRSALPIGSLPPRLCRDSSAGVRGQISPAEIRAQVRARSCEVTRPPQPLTAPHSTSALQHGQKVERANLCAPKERRLEKGLLRRGLLKRGLLRRGEATPRSGESGRVVAEQVAWGEPGEATEGGRRHPSSPATQQGGAEGGGGRERGPCCRRAHHLSMHAAWKICEQGSRRHWSSSSISQRQIEHSSSSTWVRGRGRG